jgi:sugar-specific transcriptional regulator TrmB
MAIDTKGLERMGLSRAEATVYLTILHGGRLNLASLSDKSGINRTTLYAYLHTLLNKGYIKETVLGKRTYYIAENPKVVLIKYRLAGNELESNLKELMAVFSTVKQTPGIMMYQEKEGLQDLYRDIVAKASYIKSIFSPDRYYAVFSAKDDTFVEDVKRKGIKGQVLVERSESSEKRRGHKETKDYTYRYLEKGYSPTINMIVFNGHTALISFESLFGVLISNDLISKYHEDLFDKEWRRSI